MLRKLTLRPKKKKKKKKNGLLIKNHVLVENFFKILRNYVFYICGKKKTLSTSNVVVFSR